MTEDGLYVMLYTAWNRKTPRLAVATSRDLKNWTKHGLAFEKAYDGRFARIATKSASMLTKVKGGKLVIDKVVDELQNEIVPGIRNGEILLKHLLYSPSFLRFSAVVSIWKKSRNDLSCTSSRSG